jgi:hypothetical protein
MTALEAHLKREEKRKVRQTQLCSSIEDEAANPAT